MGVRALPLSYRVAATAFARVNWTRKMLPLPTSLWTSICPPWHSTISLLIVSPKPVPRIVPSFTRKKG